MAPTASQLKNKKKKQKKREKERALASNESTKEQDEYLAHAYQQALLNRGNAGQHPGAGENGEDEDEEQDGDDGGADTPTYEEEEEAAYMRAQQQHAARAASAAAEQQRQYSALPSRATNTANNSASNPQISHEALLGTANDLYKQIETAAAAALSGHFPMPAGAANATNGESGTGRIGEEDDAYWLSLPSHLRSFIRSALPLAAGLSGPGANGSNAAGGAGYVASSARNQQDHFAAAAAGMNMLSAATANANNGGNGATMSMNQHLNLTPDQMAAAAAQLAQVVQSGWASTLAKEPLDSPLRQAAAAAAAAQQQQQQTGRSTASPNGSTTTTIPLGAFALPLHPHPDSAEGREAAAQAAANGGAGSLPPFPSLASLQNSLLELAKMHPNLTAAAAAAAANNGGGGATSPGGTANAGAAGIFPGFPSGFTMGSPPPTSGQQAQQGVQQRAETPDGAKTAATKGKNAKKKGAAVVPPAAVPQQQPLPQAANGRVPPNPNPPPSMPPPKLPPSANRGAVATQTLPTRVAAATPPSTQLSPAAQATIQKNNEKVAAMKSQISTLPPSAQRQQAQPNAPRLASQPISNAPPNRHPPTTQAPAVTQPQAAARPAAAATTAPLSAVASGKARAIHQQPMVSAKSAVPVVPSAPAKSVTGNTINNPPPPPAAPTSNPTPQMAKRTGPLANPNSNAQANAHSRDSTQASTPVSGSPATATHNQSLGPVASSSSNSVALTGEREKIRDFWLGLSEPDRRGLVKIEKDAVLKKMKEQQRHGCTCAVCGRKRNAIEVELEVLYDAYYDELESYANHQQLYKKSGGNGTIPPPIGPGPFPGSVDVSSIVNPPAPAPSTTAQSTPAPAQKNTRAPTSNTAGKRPPPISNNARPGVQRPGPPASAIAAAAAKNAAATPPAMAIASKAKGVDHVHSPSCPHYPHTHGPNGAPHHHHHHPAPNSAQARGKGTAHPPPQQQQQPAQQQQQERYPTQQQHARITEIGNNSELDQDADEEGYSDEEEDEDEDDDEREYDDEEEEEDEDEEEYDEDDYVGTEEGEEMEDEDDELPPLDGMSSGGEEDHHGRRSLPPVSAPQQPQANMPPSSRRIPSNAHGVVPPPPPAAGQARRGNTPLSQRTTAPPQAAAPQQQPAAGAKKTSSTNPGNDFFGFGSSLTVKGGILTVADDLLKNDGQKFLEMMESLADKRIQREREAAEGLLDDEDEEDEDDEDEDDEEYDEDEDEEDEEDDEQDEGDEDHQDGEGGEEVLTEEQRMEEGRRMFQIFAARMFEQRVLTAYREKVAQERQSQLLRELEEEDRAAAEREAKKAKDAQKKKDKKKLAKQQKDQERLQKEEDRLAAEAAAKAEAEARAEEERRRAEEQKLKRETERKAKEAEAQRKEEAKKARLAEEARKKKEKDEKAREAKLQREKEEKERKAKEEAEKKVRQEQERKEREERLAKEKEVAAKRAADKAERERLEKEKQAAEQAAKDAAAKILKEKEKAAAAANAAAAAATAAASANARTSPTASKQTPGVQSRSISAGGKMIPGMPKTPAPPLPSSSSSIPPGFTSSPNAGAPPLQAMSSSPSIAMSSPLPHYGQQQSMLSAQRPSQRSFSSSAQGQGMMSPAPGLAPMNGVGGHPGLGRQPSSAMPPVFGQQGIPGFIPQQQQQQTSGSFGSIGGMPIGQSSNNGRSSGLPPPGIGMNSRSFSPMQQTSGMPQQQQQFQQQQGYAPPGMSASISPISARSPFPNFGSSAPGANNPAASSYQGGANRVNGFSAAPGGIGTSSQQPLPIGHDSSSSSLLSPGPQGPISITASPPAFQHSATGLAALNMDSQVVSRSTPSIQHAQLGLGQPTASSSSSTSTSAIPMMGSGNASGSSSAAPGHARRISGSSNVAPIGRPGGRFGGSSGIGNADHSFSFNASDLGLEDGSSSFVGSASASLRSISPPPAVLGSGALLDDMLEEEEGLDDVLSGASPSVGNRSTSFFGSGVFAPPGIGGGTPGTGRVSSSATTAPSGSEDVWGQGGGQYDSPSKRGVMPPPGVPGAGAGWGAPSTSSIPTAAPIVAPDRASVIRDRARISFTQLDAASQPNTGGSLYPIGDVYRVFLALYPDSTSVDVREFLESCLIPGTHTNGNGTFNFQQRGNVLLMAYEGARLGGLPEM